MSEPTEDCSPCADSAARPEGWTDAHEVVAQALYADTWTEAKPDDPNPDWHRRFPWWQCVRAARYPATD